MSTNAVDAKLIMELRRRTLYPISDCKQALLNAGGDIDAAEALMKRGDPADAMLQIRQWWREYAQKNNPPSAH